MYCTRTHMCVRGGGGGGSVSSGASFVIAETPSIYLCKRGKVYLHIHTFTGFFFFGNSQSYLFHSNAAAKYVVLFAGRE